MAKITYMPTEEVVVHQALDSDSEIIFFEDVVKKILVKEIQVTPTINRIDGIAFAILHFPDMESLLREELKGRMHFAAVLFTKVPCQSELVVNFGEEDIRIRLRKQITTQISLT